MTVETSARRAELFDASYAYVLDHGLYGLSLRPLASAIGTSPRVLLYLFGSKDGLVRDLLDRARREHIAQMTSALDSVSPDGGFDKLADHLWAWLSAPEQRPMVRLTYEAFMLSIGHEPGPWKGFASESARDWLNLLIDLQVDVPQAIAEARATRVLATMRGLLIDVLANGDNERVAAAARLGWR